MDRKTDVLALLKAQGAASLAEVAAHLGVSKQGALRHLEALQARGLVEVSSDQHHRPGRPGHVYRLTAAAAELFPSSHRQLAADLVEFLDESDLERFFSDRAARLRSLYEERMQGLDFDSRVRELARLTSQGGHMTEVVERPAGGLALRHCNCPIQDVATRTGHACRQELEMYERLLGEPVSRSSWLKSGDPTCTYEINATKG